MTERLTEFLRARYAEDRAIALNTAQPDTSWKNFDMDGELRDNYNAGTVAIVPRAETRAHISRHDPATVLIDLESKNALINDILSDKHVVVEGDPWYTCPQATDERDGGSTSRDDFVSYPCDCGRDERVRRRLLLLAAPYAQHPDYLAACSA